MRKIVFLSFADSKYKPTLKRIKTEALESQFFSEVKILTENDLDKEYRKKYKQRFKLRGFGYWMWKSYVVKRTINNLNENDIIIYADAGCTINNDAKKRFDEYISYVDNNPLGILAFSQEELIEKYYTKGDLFEITNSRENKDITDTPQIWAGAFIIRKNPMSVKFVTEWEYLCRNNFYLITDKPSVSKNFEGFITHRHDQSAFSVLLKPYKPYLITDKETYTTGIFEKDLICFPIWATRKRQYTWLYLKKEGLKKRLNKILNR